VTVIDSPIRAAGGSRLGRHGRGAAKVALRYAISLGVGLLVWQFLAVTYGPGLVASPSQTLKSAIDLTQDGRLLNSVIASSRRILIGWGLGVVIGAPLGLLMGRVKLIRQFMDPYIEFFRFIPPIAFVTLAIVWLGLGEASKVVLIFYTSVFIVTISSIAGVLAISEDKLRAAASLGANKRQILRWVVLPASVPSIVTGARLAMGNSFLTIVSAEIVAANVGLGALIWQSRNFGRIDWVFVGIITLGILGFIFDRVLRLVAGRVLARYSVKL
jgi:NitT/TauT family transport system permease protein